jgi:flagellar biosynthetic protein FlhB
MADSGEKTEDATEKRMKEVRSKGQLSRSQDLTAWLGMGAAAVMIPLTVSNAAGATSAQFAAVASLIKHPDSGAAVQALFDGLGSLGGILLPMLIVVAIAVLGGAAIQGGITFRSLTPKLEHLNIIAGAKHMVSLEAFWNGGKAILKTVIVGIVLVVVIQGLLPVLNNSGGLSAQTLLTAAGGGVTALVEAAVVSGLALAAVDGFVVMRRNRQKTRMSKQEVKDENKSSEGDPLIKSQRRSRQLAMSRNRMMAAVATADVVLVNPTHFAIALKYEPGKSAPRVVAKGAGVIALRIREQAETDQVPIVKDIPLTRALHAQCDLGSEIPVDLYNAVARVLAFVMALKTRGASRGTHTMTSLYPALASGPGGR